MTELLNIIFALLTLTILEIVLGIDNLVFLAIMTQRLPKHQQKSARRWGLTFAWVTRLLLLFCAVWLTTLTAPLFHIFDLDISGRDIFMLLGGLFLLYKATQEMHAELESHIANKAAARYSHFSVVVAQIAILDIIFSLDSVLTAIGMTRHFWLMATAITIAILTMIFASEPLSDFIERHPTIKILALSFLLLIGMVLVADAFGFYIPRGYLYFAMGFSLFVEFMNMLRLKKAR